MDKSIPGIKLDGPFPENSVGCWFVFRILAVALLVLAGATAFNLWVDPYDVVGRPRVAGLNARKPQAIHHVRTTKIYQMLRGQPKLVLLGNSRVDLGFDTECAAVPDRYRPVYNAGQPGGGVTAPLRAVRLLPDGGSRMLLLGVDYLDCLARPSEPPQALPASPAVLTYQERLRDHAAAFASLDATLDSLITVNQQRDPFAGNITPAGFNTGHPFLAVYERQGRDSLVAEKNEEIAARLLAEAYDPKRSSDGSVLSVLLDEAAMSGDVVVFTHPYHADVLDLIESQGHSDDFEHWKSAVEKLCQAREVPYYDFAVRSVVTTHPWPSDPAQPSIYYWESGHYRASVGDLILEAVFENRGDLLKKLR